MIKDQYEDPEYLPLEFVAVGMCLVEKDVENVVEDLHIVGLVEVVGDVEVLVDLLALSGGLLGGGSGRTRGRPRRCSGGRVLWTRSCSR